MSWDDVTPGGGGGEFLKIEDGQTVRVHVLSEQPMTHYTYFNEQAKRSVVVPEDWSLGEKAKKHAVAVVMMTVDAKGVVSLGDVRIWVMSNTVAGELKNIYENYDNSLAGVDLRITRKGTSKKTKYGVVPVPTKFTEDMLEGLTIPDLETHDAFQPSDEETVAKVMSGENPDDDEPAPEGEPVAEEPAAEEVPAEEPAPEGEPEPEAEEPPPAPKKAAVPAAGADPRMPLIRAITHAFATKPKFKDPKVKLALFKRIGSKKTAVTQMSLDELKKLQPLVK